MRTKIVNGRAVPMTAAEEAYVDAKEADWSARKTAREAELEERRKDAALLNETKLMWIIETLVGELEAIRRNEPPTARAIALRNRLDAL